MINLYRSSFLWKNVGKNAGHKIVKRTTSSEPKLYELSDRDVQREAKLQPLVKEPNRPPFVKNLFNGKFDVDLLSYTEFLGERRLHILNMNSQIIENLVTESINSSEIDQTCSIPEKLLNQLRSLKLFGCTAPADYGGLELTCTERARLYEIIGKDTSVAATLFCQETLGHKVISRFGNEHQKDKYLKKLVSGKSMIAYCANETKCGSDIANLETKALISGNDYIISGSKTWVMNADSADYFLVFAHVITFEQDQNPENKYYASTEKEELSIPNVAVFIIDRHAPGIIIEERKDTVGVRGLHMSDVTFEHVTVSKDAILGDEQLGYEIARQFLVEDRHMIGIFALSVLKNLQKDMTEFAIKRDLYGASLSTYGLTQFKLTNVTINTYVIESVAYFTCGLIDMYENQDCEVENAIAKVLCSELAWESVCEGMELLGGQAYIRNSPYDRYMRNIKILSLFDVHNDVLKMFIALSGLKHVSEDLDDVVFENRNPYFHPKEVFSRMFSQVKLDMGKPKMNLKLYENIHPSMCVSADMLEKCVLKFQYGVNCSLSREGRLVVNNQFILKRIAECAMLLYAMTACISRCSRAYCIGSANADQQMMLTEIIVRNYYDKFEVVHESLISGDISVPDALMKKVADRIIETKGYFVEEPLKLNY